ncbi:IS4 family transposase [Thermotalea metallivorans]|uniref:Transposase IS701-like DDE domain-containing protein n=1 Tax=Thermotalea metallivorans TaxID=520762 RepID=A0A140L2Z7_9FIRM|nr:transposase [Thermotalea metallivorans]KXG74922.1 hypothetical protein AN619_20210 [Thermotalea metallivorans]
MINFLKIIRLAPFLNNVFFLKRTDFHVFQFLSLYFCLCLQVKTYIAHSNQTVIWIFQKIRFIGFLNSSRFNWRKYLLLLSSSIIKNSLTPLTSDKRVKVPIVDDSMYSRSRSKSVELLAKVFDHVQRKYLKGFRLLTLGWSDGNTFLPVAFSLLSSEKEENRLCSISSSVDKRTHGYKLRKEAIRKSPSFMIDMISQAVQQRIPASYVLFDSWFTYPQILIKIVQLKLHTISMVKSMYRVYYNYNGKKLNLNDLYASLKKKRGKAKILSSVIVGIGSDENGREVKAKIVSLLYQRKISLLTLRKLSKLLIE